jgi:hypothetical protein
VVIEEIIERAIKFYRVNLHYDSSYLFETLMRLRNCESIFELLDKERIKIENGESALLKASSVKPTLTWRV